MSDSDAVPVGAIIKQGWLTKSDPKGERWGDRYFVLSPTTVTYFLKENKADSDLRGAFYLNRAQLGVGWPLGPAKRPPADKKFLFYLALPDRTFYLCAPTLNSFNSWVATFERQLSALQDRPPNPELAQLDGGYGPGPVHPSRMSAPYAHSDAVEAAAVRGLHSPLSSSPLASPSGVASGAFPLSDAKGDNKAAATGTSAEAVGLRAVSSNFQLRSASTSAPGESASVGVSDKQLEGLQAQLAELQHQYAAFSAMRSPMDTYAPYTYRNNNNNPAATTSTRNNKNADGASSSLPAAAASVSGAAGDATANNASRAEFAPVPAAPVVVLSAPPPAPASQEDKGKEEAAAEAEAARKKKEEEQEVPITFFVNFVPPSSSSSSSTSAPAPAPAPRQFTMAVKPSKRESLTMRSIKKKIAKALNATQDTAAAADAAIDADKLVLTVQEDGEEGEGGPSSSSSSLMVLEDEWTAKDIDLTEGAVLTLTVVEAAPVEENNGDQKTAEGEGHEEDSNKTGAKTRTAPPPPPPRRPRASGNMAADSNAVIGHRQARSSVVVHGHGEAPPPHHHTTAASGAAAARKSLFVGAAAAAAAMGQQPQRGAPRASMVGPMSISAQQRKDAAQPSSLRAQQQQQPQQQQQQPKPALAPVPPGRVDSGYIDQRTAVAQERLSHLRSLFAEVAATTSSSSPVHAATRVGRTDLATIVSSDPIAATWPETEPLTLTLISPVSTVFGSALLSVAGHHHHNGTSGGSSSGSDLSGGGESTISWEELVAVTAEISSHFHHVQAEEEGRMRAEHARAEAEAEAEAEAHALTQVQQQQQQQHEEQDQGEETTAVADAPAPALAPAPAPTAAPVTTTGSPAATIAPRSRSPSPPPPSSPPKAQAAASAASGGGGSAGQHHHQHHHRRRQHVMVMTVESPLTGIAEELHVSSSTDPDALALDFITRHNLSRSEFEKPLAEEIRKSLVEALTLELADSEGARAAAEARAASLDAQLRHATQALLKSSGSGSSDANSNNAANANANANGISINSELLSSAAIAAAGSSSLNALGAAQLSGAQAISALAVAQAQLADSKARMVEDQARLQVLEAEAVHLRQALHQATTAKEGMEAATGAVTSELGQLKAQVEALQLDNENLKVEAARAAGSSATGLRHQQLYFGSGAGDSTGPAGAALTATSSANAAAAAENWRSWAQEKRELLARANADRSALMEENKRLRTALDARASDVEKQLREADSERADLKAAVTTLTASLSRGETELKAVYSRWQNDAQTYANERQSLCDQLQMLATALQQRELMLVQAGLSLTPAHGTTTGSAGPTSAFPLAGQTQAQGQSQLHFQQQH